MGFRLQLLVYSLMIVIMSFWRSSATSESIESLPFNRSQDLNIYYQNELTVNSIKESIDKFIQSINDLLVDINFEKFNFLSNIDNEGITKFIRQIKAGQCVGEQYYQQSRTEFLTRYLFVEYSVRAAIAELEGKVEEMKRSLTLERDTASVEFQTCELLGAVGNCENISNALESSSSEPNDEFLVFPGMRDTVGSELRPAGHLSTECPNGLFKCRSGKCILPEYVCDGQSDCPDQSDEISYCERNCHGKRCRNLNCISSNQICDGKDDCGDGTDEENCIMAGSTETGTLDECNLNNENFLCSDKTLCMSIKSVCDGEANCFDDSDEGENCSVTTGCDRCFAMGGACLRSPAGPLCLSSCPSGFILQWQSGLCILSDSAEGTEILYESSSLPELIRKINVLSRRLINFYDIMKKYTKIKISQAAENLNKCLQRVKGDPSVSFF